MKIINKSGRPSNAFMTYRLEREWCRAMRKRISTLNTMETVCPKKINNSARLKKNIAAPQY